MKTQPTMKNEKLYTLQEAYDHILKIKKDMGLRELQERELKNAFKNGYAKACNDLQEDFNKALVIRRRNYFLK